MIAHEAIFDMSRELRAQGSISAETESLVRESAQIVIKMLPAVTGKVRRLADRWSELDLLDPLTATTTLREIKSETERISPEIERLLARQGQIAGDLRDLLEK